MAKIVVIEDEQHIRDEVTSWLQFEGHEVHNADNGQTGLDMIFQLKPELIICDIRMPGMNGFEVLLTVRSKPQTSDIPFVFITASAERESMRYGMKLGADDYITKPFTYKEILDAVNARIQKHALEKEVLGKQMDTLQNALDNEVEKRVLKSRIVAMFSHDFRNPLALIQSSANLLINYNDKLDEEKRINKLKQITGSVQLLMQMLDDMLLIAEMEDVSFRPHAKPLDIAEFVQAVLSDFSDIFIETHEFNTLIETHDRILIDEKLLRHILHNVLSNAVKYSPDNAEVFVSVKRLHNHIEIVIQDYGIGIPDDYMPDLFEPFKRADNTGNIAGTGLGLSIVKQALDYCSGRIEVESTVGQGSKFKLLFPVIVDENRTSYLQHS